MTATPKDNIVLDATDINRMVTRIAHEILEKHKNIEKLALIGIQTRGVFIARRIQAEIRKVEGVTVPVGEIDITLYRDDWTRISHHPIVKPTEIQFTVDNMAIILVDDVLFTGRTIGPPWTHFSISAARHELNLRFWLTGVTESFPFSPIIQAGLSKHNTRTPSTCI